jgi:hypothetical protein
MDVFDIEESGKLIGVYLRRCTTCRKCLKINGIVSIEKIFNHYEFTVESIGVRPAFDLIKEAFQILAARSQEMMNTAHEALSH